MRTYSIKKHTVSFLAQTIVGYGPDTVIKASFLEDAFTLQIGNDGDGARSLNPNESGEIEITLRTDSPSHDILSAIAIGDRLRGDGVGPLFVKDGSGTSRAGGEEAWIKKMPDLERAKEVGTCTWVFSIKKMEMNVGGTTDGA